jgi:hypothetical protein
MDLIGFALLVGKIIRQIRIGGQGDLLHQKQENANFTNMTSSKRIADSKIFSFL